MSMLIKQIRKTKILNIILDASLFTKMMLFLMLINNFPYIEKIVTVTVQIISVVWAPIIIIGNLKFIKENIKKNFYWLLLLTACSYAITILINYKYNFIQNSKTLVWLIIYICILLIWWKMSRKDLKNLLKDIEQINWIIIIVNVINVLPSFVLYITNFHIDFHGRPIGMYFLTNRLFGILNGLNSSVMIAFVSILATMWNMRIEKNMRKRKIVCWGNIICSYIFIIASGTRSVRFIMSVMGAFYCFSKLWEKWFLSNELKSKWKAIAQSTVGGVLAFLLLYTLVELSRYPIGMLHFSNIMAITSNNESDDSLEGTIEITVRDSGENMSDTLKSDDRYIVWKECIRLWKEYPIFGIGVANKKIYADISPKQYDPIISSGVYGVSTHNMLISMLLYSGIMGTVMFGGYLFFRMVTGFYHLLKKKGMRENINTNMLFSFMICISLCIYGMSDAVIIYSHVSITVLFWVYLSIMELSENFMENGSNLDYEI